MANMKRSPVFMLFCTIAIVCLMIGYSHYPHLTDNGDNGFAFRDVTNRQSLQKTVVAPMLRLPPKTKTDVIVKNIEPTIETVIPTAKLISQPNDVTDYATSQENLKQIGEQLVNNSQLNDVTDYATSQRNSIDSRKARGRDSKPPSNRNQLASRKKLRQPRHFNISRLELIPSFDVPHQPDQVYAVPDLETLRLEHPERKLPIFVLLVTYARSGSTWLGSITSQAANSMYVYEPFQHILKQAYYKKNEVCAFNDFCGAPTKITEKHEFAITVLYRIFTCQFTKLHTLALEKIMKNLRSTSMKPSFDRCVKSNNSYTKCLHELEEKCMQTDHRIVKTIRVSMELARIMLDLWPNLKILHLSRDPRGITNSRQHRSSTFTYVRSIDSHSRALCSIMLEDTENDKLISTTFPGRSKILLYEALAERPIEGAKYIYDFIETKLTDELLKWVYTTSHADVKKESYFGTNRANSSQSAYQWRTEIKLPSVKVIDKTCEKVYERLGFLPLNTNDKLRSFDIPSRITQSHIDGFV